MMQIKEKINKNNIYNISFILLIILLAIVNKISVIPDNTKWQANHNSNIRVILSEVIDNKLLIGLNIKLDKDSYTYWKNPGDTGLEPSIKIDEHPELIKYNIQWPVPYIIKDKYGINYAYKDDLVIPIELQLTNKGGLIDMGLNIEYGVCSDICVPIQDRIKLKIINNIENYKNNTNKFLKKALLSVPKYRHADQKVISNARILNIGGSDYIKIKFSESVKGIIIDGSDNFQFFDMEDAKEYYKEYKFSFRSFYKSAKIEGERISAIIFLKTEYFLEDFFIQ
ncbi:MAG: protein-disulfide reductase DsbD family protein [Hyphomicrobiales bacterium]|nr:protein-disulfide reductase DsbD family protein [Hyphomicrobiales bacterium]